jgi:thiosulfate/3-mercaptopyruvate sulfurtransferase
MRLSNGEEKTMTRILRDPEEVFDTMLRSADLVLLDTREPAAFARSHIPGAVNVPEVTSYLATSDRAGMRALRDKFSALFGAAGLSGGETAVVYEQSMESGHGQSCRGYVLLKYLGYPDASVLHGGLSAWTTFGFPVTSEATPSHPRKFPTAELSTDTLVTRDEMLRALDQPEIIKLDVRDVDEWIGESSSPYGKDFAPRKGRIPGARWIEWYRMLKPGPSGVMIFKDPHEILAECETASFGPDSLIYIYCFKGARASSTFVALRNAGFKQARVYLGSWNEWSRDRSLPIEQGLPYALHSVEAPL